MNTEILEFEINPDIIKQFQSDLDNLVKIDSILKIKISDDNIMFYAKSGEKRTIHAFKCYIYERDEFIVNCNDDSLNMDFIVINSTNFAKSLKVITTKKDYVKIKIEKYEKEKVATRMYISDGKINMNFLGGGYLEIRDFTMEYIESQMDKDLADFTFTLDKENFTEIKKLALLNKNEVVNFRVNNNKLEFFDTRWCIEVGKTTEDYDDTEWVFNVKYFKTINSQDNLTFYVFNQFLLIRNNNEVYMIALQLSI